MNVVRNIQKHIENALITAVMFVLMCLMFVAEKVCHVETDTLFDDYDSYIFDKYFRSE